MADVFAPIPVKTKTNGDVSVKIDQTTPGTTNLVALAANQSVNNAQVSGTAVDVNSGTKSAGTMRVVLATDQPQLTNKLLVTPDSVALPANQSVNVAQLAGTTTDTNSGTKSAGTLRVILATDQPALTNKLLVTPDSVALPANQSVNQAQVGGVTTAVGSGASNTGTQRVILATDTPTITVTQGLAFTTTDSGHLTSAALAAGATVTLDSPQIGSGTGKLYEATVSSSVALKAQLGTWDGTTFTVKRTFFVPSNTAFSYAPARYDAITMATGATAKFRWSITNNDNANAADVYASITYAI